MKERSVLGLSIETRASSSSSSKGRAKSNDKLNKYVKQSRSS